MEAKLQELKQRLLEVNDLNSAAALLSWDQSSYMPEAGAAKSGYSVNHGAGRRLSRGEAVRQLDQRKVDEQYRRDGILVNLDGRVPLDESNACYKSAEEVVSAVVAAKLARIEHTLWPLASIKGDEKGASRARQRANKGRDRARDEARHRARKTKSHY